MLNHPLSQSVLYTFIVKIHSGSQRTLCSSTSTHTLTHTDKDTLNYLLDSVQQSAVAVDHDQHRQSKTEDEEANDVGMRLGRPQRPRHRTTGASSLEAIATPAD